MAAAARPEPIRSGFKLGLPLWLQRILHPRLVAAVDQHRNSERAHFCFITGLCYVHPPDRGRLMRADRGVHLHRHLGPCLTGQRDQPVDPRRPAARVPLRYLPRAYQRVAPAPQHQLLKVPGQRPVTVLHRLENPPAQPPYLLLMTPVVALSVFPAPVATMAGAVALGLFRELRTRPVMNRPRTSRRGQVEHNL